MISSSQLDTFQAAVYRKTDSIACQDDPFGPTQSTQPGLSFGGQQANFCTVRSALPEAKTLWPDTPGRQVVFLVISIRSGGICQLCCFSAPVPCGDGRQSAALSDADFCHHFPSSPGALPRLPTDLENASVHFVCLLGLTHHALARHSIAAAYSFS